MRRSHEPWREIFHVLGALLFIGGCLALAMMLNLRAAVLRNRHIDILVGWPLPAWAFLSAIGMFRCTRWGAALFAAAPAMLFLWWAVGSLADGAFASFIAALALSPFLLIPAYLAYRNWKRLK